MFGVLYCFGNLPVKKEMFMIMVIRVFNLSLNSFKIRFGIEFGPTAFLVLILPIMLVIFFYLLVVAKWRTNFCFSNGLRSASRILVFFDKCFVLLFQKIIELISNFFVICS